MDNNAANSVLYALSTLAQTCAALAALVGALALYRLQAMREVHAGHERLIREGLSRIGGGGAFTDAMAVLLPIARQNMDQPGFQYAVPEFATHDERFARALGWFIGFESWNLFAIFVSLAGFACVPWLASHWYFFVVSLVVCSAVTVAVTGLAMVVSIARGYAAWADHPIKEISQRFSQLRARLFR